MRFGGHETFAVREGWLSKGLRLIDRNPGAFNDPFVSDELGVGRNMAKSIFHWLTVTGLARKEGKDRSLFMTDIGKVVFSRDPYFLSRGTWWALHINILLQEEDAVAWRVFFGSDFPGDRFDRVYCNEEMRRRVASEQRRPPGAKTLAKDVACLLASYASPLPPEDSDPEEGRESPFRSLGLITYLKETGVYRINRHRDVPPAILGYAISSWKRDEFENGGFEEVEFSEALAEPRSPGMSMCLNIEGLSSILDSLSARSDSELIHVRQLGGRRFIRIKSLSPSDWLERYYAEQGQKRDA